MNTATPTNLNHIYPEHSTAKSPFTHKVNLQNKPILKSLANPINKWIYDKNSPERNTRKQTHF